MNIPCSFSRRYGIFLFSTSNTWEAIGSRSRKKQSFCHDFQIIRNSFKTPSLPGEHSNFIALKWFRGMPWYSSKIVCSILFFLHLCYFFNISIPLLFIHGTIIAFSALFNDFNNNNNNEFNLLCGSALTGNLCSRF